MPKNYRAEFYAILILLGMATLYITKPYLGMIVMAFIIAMVFDPLYQKYFKILGHRSVASIATSISIFVILILPFIVVGSMVAREAIYFADSLDTQQAINQIENLGKEIEDSTPVVIGRIYKFANTDDTKISDATISLAKSVSIFLSSKLVPAAQVGISTIVKFTIFVFILIYMIPTKDNILKYLLSISPVSREDSQKLKRRFESIVSATIKGTFVIAIVQGVLGGLAFWVLSIPAPFLWGSLMAIFSIVPMLGSAMIWLPAAIILILTGSLVEGVLLILWGSLVVGSVDNLMRPKLMGRGEAAMPELLTLVSVLGGIQAFGFFGFIYGPVVAALFVTTLDMYRDSLKR